MDRKGNDEIFEPRVTIAGMGSIPLSEWRAGQPKKISNLIFEHESGGRLYMGGTLDRDDMSAPGFGRKPWQPSIREEHFDAVVTMYAPAAPPSWFVVERRFPIMDGDVSGLSPRDYRELLDLVRDTQDRVKRGERVLVRCQAGLNRSGLVTAMTLMGLGLTSDEAIDLIRRRRSRFCLANGSFVTYLRSLDRAPVAS